MNNIRSYRTLSSERRERMMDVRVISASSSSSTSRSSSSSDELSGHVNFSERLRPERRYGRGGSSSGGAEGRAAKGGRSMPGHRRMINKSMDVRVISSSSGVSSSSSDELSTCVCWIVRVRPERREERGGGEASEEAEIRAANVQRSMVGHRRMNEKHTSWSIPAFNMLVMLFIRSALHVCSLQRLRSS